VAEASGKVVPELVIVGDGGAGAASRILAYPVGAPAGIVQFARYLARITLSSLRHRIRGLCRYYIPIPEVVQDRVGY
jgi:hypothetical protein